MVRFFVMLLICIICKTAMSNGNLNIDDDVSYSTLTNMSAFNKDHFTSLTIINQEINEDFAYRLTIALNYFTKIRTLKFDNCQFGKVGLSQVTDFSFLSVASLNELAIINSQLTADDLEQVLQNLGGYTERKLDFSGNQLEKDPNKLYNIKKRYFNGGKFAISYPGNLIL